MKNYLNIVRGMPGSGKSCFALRLGKREEVMVFEPDVFDRVGGDYCYTPERHELSEQRCLSVMNYIERLRAADGLMSFVYVDVLPRLEDVGRIVNGFAPTAEGMMVVRVFDLGKLSIDEAGKRNRHAVRRCDLEAMSNGWESLAGNPFGWEVVFVNQGAGNGHC